MAQRVGHESGIDQAVHDDGAGAHDEDDEVDGQSVHLCVRKEARSPRDGGRAHRTHGQLPCTDSSAQMSVAVSTRTRQKTPVRVNVPSRAEPRSPSGEWWREPRLDRSPSPSPSESCPCHGACVCVCEGGVREAGGGLGGGGRRGRAHISGERGGARSTNGHTHAPAALSSPLGRATRGRTVALSPLAPPVCVSALCAPQEKTAPRLRPRSRSGPAPSETAPPPPDRLRRPAPRARVPPTRSTPADLGWPLAAPRARAPPASRPVGSARTSTLVRLVIYLCVQQSGPSATAGDSVPRVGSRADRAQRVCARVGPSLVLRQEVCHTDWLTD